MENAQGSWGNVFEFEIKTRSGTVKVVVDKDKAAAVERVKRWGIYKDPKGRKLARAGKDDGQIMLHRYLYDIPKGGRLEWVDGNTLDLRRKNIKLFDKDGNRIPHRIPAAPAKTPTPLVTKDFSAVELKVLAAQAKEKGVTFHKATQKWHSRPYWEGTRYSLGYFNTLDEANTETRIFMQEGPDSPKLKRNQKRGK